MPKPNVGILATKDWVTSLINKVIKKGFNGYSTDEKRIGTWVNNKPLYRRVISINKSYSTGTDNNITTLPDTDVFVRADAFLIWSDGSKQMICSSGADDDSLYVSNKDELKFFNHSGYSINIKYAILEYTKTTD